MTSDDCTIFNLLFLFTIYTSKCQTIFSVSSPSDYEFVYDVNLTANTSSSSYLMIELTNVSDVSDRARVTQVPISSLNKSSTTMFTSATTSTVVPETTVTTSTVVPETTVTTQTLNVGLSLMSESESTAAITSAVLIEHTTSYLVINYTVQPYSNTSESSVTNPSTTIAVPDHHPDVTLPTEPKFVGQHRPLSQTTPTSLSAHQHPVRVEVSSTNIRRLPPAKVSPTYRKVADNVRRGQTEYGTISTRGNIFSNERFGILPFPVLKKLPSPPETQPGAFIRVGRKRNRQPVTWKPLPWRKTQIPATSTGKSLRRNEIMSRWQHKIHPFLLTMAVTTPTSTAATTSLVSSANEGITASASGLIETQNQHNQQLMLGACVVCSLAVGGALIAAIGVSVARCRDLLLRRRRSGNDDENDGVIPEVDDANMTSSESTTNWKVIRISSGWFSRQCLVDCANCFRSTLSRRLMNDNCDTPPPNEERKRGDGVESRPEVTDTLSGLGLKINRPPEKVQTMKQNTDDPPVLVRNMIDSFNRKFRPASASSAACNRPSSNHHARIYMTKRCQQLQATYHQASRFGMTSSLASLPLPPSTSVFKEIALKESRNTSITRSAPASAAVVPRRQTSSVTNRRKASTSQPLQSHSLDGASCFTASQTEHSSNPQEYACETQGASIDCTINRPANLVVSDTDGGPISAATGCDLSVVDQLISDDVVVSELYVIGRDSAIAVEVSKANDGLEEKREYVGHSTGDVNHAYDNSIETYESEKTPELNDVIRQSEILKSFRRVAPPRSSNGDRRSRLPNYSLGGSTAVSLATTTETDENEQN